MNEVQMHQIEHYLATGERPAHTDDWPGNFMSAARMRDEAMTTALIAEVKRRAEGRRIASVPGMDFAQFTRSKVAPMVNGLFPAAERSNVLDMLEKSVVFITTDNIEQILSSMRWAQSAWDVANLYLLSIGAEPLGGKGSGILGLSEETTCYVSHEYFTVDDKFADFVVHEAAHVFHNCKRETVGLKETRTREFLLNIDFKERETFAYACEVYSRILEQSKTRQERISLAAEAVEEFHPPDEKVDVDKFRRCISEAAEARNGWKRILEICSPMKQNARDLAGRCSFYRFARRCRNRIGGL